MSDNDFNPELDNEQFRIAIVRYLEGQLTAAELVDFNRELRADANKRQVFAEVCLIRAGLIEELKGRGEFAGTLDWWTEPQESEPAPHDLGETMMVPAIQPSADEDFDEPEFIPSTIVLPTTPQPKPNHLRIWVTAAIVLFALTLGAVVWKTTSHPAVTSVAVVNQPAKLKTPVAPSLHETTTAPAVLPKSLGTLVMAVDARWADETHLAAGSPLGAALGRLNLLSGVVHFKLNDGVSLVIQGPAQFKIETASLVYLYNGKLSAELPHNGATLTAVTPDMRAVDLGTEFGLDVSAKQQTHLEVFSGRVRAEVPQAAGTSVTQTLTANQAVVAVAGLGTIQQATPTPLVFVRTAEMDALAQGGTSAYDRWRSFSETLRQDPDMVAYYPFDNRTESPDKLLNRASATKGIHDGLFGNDTVLTQVPKWSTGRWPGKDALQFGAHGGSAVTLQGANSLISGSAITVGVWLKRDETVHAVHFINGSVGSHTGFNLNLLGTSDKTNSRLKARTAYFTWSGKDVASSPSLPVDQLWYFLAITGTVGGDISFYVNGDLVSTATGNTSPVPALEKLVLGGPVRNDFEADHADIFKGSVDELMIFRRALSDEEILRIYKAGGAY